MTAPNTTNNVTVRKLADVAEGMWNKSKNAFVNASGDTMTGRLTMENVPINQIVTGTGTAATSSSSGGTTTYYPAKWNFDLGIATPSAGDQLVIKIPVAGHDYGTFMSTDNGTTYYPVAQSTGATRFTTRYPVNAYVFIVFEEYTGSSNSGQVNDCFALTGSTGRKSYTIGCWRVVNDYDSGNNYDCLYTANGRFRTGTTGCYPYSLVCLDNTQSYSTLVTNNPGTGTNKAVNTDGKFVFPASILYYAGNNTTAAGALVSSTYSTYLAYPTVNVQYSSNHTTTFTTNKPVYIECTLNGDGTWSPTSNSITQTLRTSYYYIYLGIAYSTEYQVSLAPEHPLYYYDGTSLVSGEVARGDITAGTNNGELNVAGTDIIVYTHPTDAGNKHIPAGGSSGQFLGYDSDGTAKWVSNPNTDTKVKATAKTDNVNYKILATASASPTSGAATEAVYDTDITLNPSNNTISANVSGTAASAGKLTTARTTYVTLGTASTSTTRDWSGTTTIPVSGTLGLGNGGTGATSAAGARTNLDVYSKSETESLLNGKVVVVTQLPATGESGVTYYVKDTSSSAVDKYDEYIWAKDAGASTESWIHVGEKSLDLSEYVNSLTTSGTGPLVKSLSKSGNVLTATLGTIAIDNLSDWASSTDVTVSSVTYHTWWPVAPTSSNQVYGLSIYNGRLYRVYNNKGTYSVQNYDANTTYTNKSLGQGYGTCATEAATAAKLVTMSDYVLTTGGIVTVKFTNALCASATMNINGKGAKPIYIKGAAVTANNAATVSAGDTAYFMYDGTAYHLLGTDRAATNPIVNISRSGTTFTATRLDGTTFTFTQQDNNTTYTQAKLGQGYGTCTTAEATAAKSVTLTGYELEPNGVVAVKFTNGLCASATMSINSKTATPIYINGAAVTSTSCKEVLAGDLAFFIYDGSHYQFICTDRISKNGITGLSISGKTITYTRADGSTGTLTTQDTTYTFDGVYNSSSNKAATVSTVTNAVNALDVDDITGFGAGKTLATLTETDGKIAATFQNISITKSQVSDFSHAHGNITNDGKVGTTADYAVVTTTGGAVTATSLATSSPSTSGNTLEFIDTVSQNSKGKISATKKKVTIDDTYSSTGTNPVSGKAIAAAIETLDVTEVGGDGKYIKKIKEDDGKITATVETMDTTPTASSTKAVTSGGIKTALDGKADNENAVYYVVGSNSYAAYSSSSTYTSTTNSGPFNNTNSCIYNDYAYYCTTTISTGEAWNSNHWAKIPTAVWAGTNSAITSLYAGLKIAYKVPSYGGSSATQLNLNGLGAKTVYRATSATTTHLPKNTIVFLAYDGNYWRWADYYSDSWVTTMGAYCSTGASTAAKAASSSNTVYTAGIAFITRFTNTNTYVGKMTYNLNSLGAKDLWINGEVSSATNYTIPAGEHWTYYDGTKICIWTDGTAQFKGLHLDTPLPDTEIASAATWNAKADDSDVVHISGAETITGRKTFSDNAIFNSVHRDTYYASNVCRYFRADKQPTQIVIWTKIGFESNIEMPKIRLYGYAYRMSAPFELNVVFYVYNNEFTAHGVISTGGMKANCYLWKYTDNTDNKDYIAIGLQPSTGLTYFLGFQVDVQVGASGAFYSNRFSPDGWTVADNSDDTSVTLIPAVGTDKCVQVNEKPISTNIAGNAATATQPKVTVLTNADDLDSIRATNVGDILTYRWTSGSYPAHVPHAGTSCVMQVINDSSTNYVKQIVYASGVNKIYERACINNSWSTWTRFLFDSDVTSTYSSTGTDPVNGTAVSAALGTLDVASAGGDGKYIKAISETDGKISATVETMDTTPTASSTNAVTSGGIKTALDSKVSSIKKNGSTINPSSGVANIGYMPTTYAAPAGTVQEVIQALRVRPGGSQGSVAVRASTIGTVNIPAAWYNYIWLPHCTGEANSDYQQYGTLLLTPLTTTPKMYLIEGQSLHAESPTYRAKILAYSDHTHGNIQNGGTLQTTDVAIANGDKLVVTDASDSNKVARTSVSFDGSTTTKALTQKGTFESFAKAADITTAIQALDVSSVGGDGKYISTISETDGKITATVETMDTAPTASSTNAVTSGGIKTALDGKQNTLATQTAYTSKGTSTKVPQITTNTLGQVTGITEVEISGVAPAPHEHEKLSYTDWANASLPNNTESGVLRRFYCSLPNYNFCVKLFDVTQFYDGTIVNNGNENSAFVGDVSFHRVGGGTLVGKSKVASGIAYNSDWVRLYGDNKFCHPIILKDSREIISTWISNSYIPIGDVGSTVSLAPTSNSNLAYCVIDCSTYSSMYINSYSVTGAPAWAFIDSTNKILTRSSDIAANSTVDVPQGAVKLICNVKNTTEYKTYCYVAIEAASPKYYLALHTEGVTMSCYMVCEGRFYTRMTATNTITARPLLTSNYILANLGASSPTIIPAGCSIQQNTIYNDVAGTLGTARKLAVSLSNTSTDTTFNGSADATNIKVTGTLPVSNGGTGKTTVTAAEYNLLSKMGTDLSVNAIADTYRFVFAVTSQSEASGRLAGYRTASSVWSWIKDKMSSDTSVDISGHADSATYDSNGNTISENAVYYVAGTTDYAAWQANKVYAVNDTVNYSNQIRVCKTAHTSGSSYDSSKWNNLGTPVLKGTINGITALYTGLKIAYKWPCTGGSSSTYLNINNLGNVYIRRNDGNTTTHVPKNTVTFLAYDGTYWRWADYDSDNIYAIHAYCGTAAATQAKAATAVGYVLAGNPTFLVKFTYANTYAGKITLNINSQGAKDIWINGAISSATNYTVPVGLWWCHYDGSAYHIWTDGSAEFKELHLTDKLSDDNIASAATWNAKQDAITYMTVAQENELISELGEL